MFAIYAKIITVVIEAKRATSRPARGAWIETKWTTSKDTRKPSRPARGAWIETMLGCLLFGFGPSRPARGAWIETLET